MEAPDTAERHCQVSPGFAWVPRAEMACLTAVSCASGSNSLPGWQRAHLAHQPVILA